MFAYCDNNPIVYLDNTGCWKEIGNTIYIADKHTYDTYYSNTNNWQPGKYYVYDPGYSKYYWELNSSKIIEHQKPNFTPRKDKRKGSENRQKTGDRERNVAHPNGEEHSRVPKGNNGINRITSIGVLVITTVGIIILTGDDAFGIVADDALIVPLASIWWDSACKIFA